MFRINTIPGKAAQEKGYADYPEDFPHLAPGEQFKAWRTEDGWEIETTLIGDALIRRVYQGHPQGAVGSGSVCAKASPAPANR